MGIIELKNLTKTFNGIRAVDCLSLSVESGEIFGFLGPNGAGKTTTLKMMVGLLVPTSGEVWIDGFEVSKDPQQVKSRVGFVPDEPFVYGKLTGEEFLHFVGGIHGMEKKLRQSRICELLEIFGLTQWADLLTESYSHGMRQRLVMASALIHNPKVLIIDEPMVGLDPEGTKTIKEIFKEFTSRFNGAVFLSTHVLKEAETLCDRIGIIHEGKLLSVMHIQQLREMEKDKDGSLESVFLHITGTTRHVDIGRIFESGDMDR